MRKKIIRVNYSKLILAVIIVGILATVMADVLKKLTEHFEEIVLTYSVRHTYIFLLLPSTGITLIYFLRKYLFKGRSNKGIKEIYQTLGNRRDELPLYKIPSHFFNGFLTVIFGGSTGIEVSTVVAGAAIGAGVYKKESIANAFKTELVCAGVAAGVATLFANPIAGFLFAIEVIAGKTTDKNVILSSALSVIVSWLYLSLFSVHPMFDIPVTGWHGEALPYFVLLSAVAAGIAVYFTRSVIFIKKKFYAIRNNFLRVNIGALLVGLSIFFLPQLFGDSYHSIPRLLNDTAHQPFSTGTIVLLLMLVLIKPLVASLTLGAGGDGGVFAPSIVVGAILGTVIAMICNHYFNTDLIILNFALVGAAAALSATIHAPLTAIALACGIVPGGYILFIPLVLGAFVAKYTASILCGYTVYSYEEKK